ncbi:MAG: O-antigen ligase family protein [Flavobacteriaceae bacterium]
MSAIRKIYPYFFALFCASFPFTDLAKAIPNILMGVLGVLFFFVVRKEDFQKLQLKSLYLFGLLILIGGFSMIIFQRWEDMSFIVRLLNIVVIILLSLPVKNYTISIKSFILSSLVLLILSSIKLLLYAKDSDSFSFTFGAHINDLLLGERPYLGMLYITSACLCWFLAEKTSGNFRYLWYALSPVFVGFVFVISARMALISLFSIVLVNLFYSKKRQKPVMVLMGGIIILGVILFSLNENIKKRFFISNTDYTVTEKLAFEPRYHIWECAFGLEQNTTSFLFGKGFKQTEDELVSCYKTREKFHTEDQKQWFVTKKFNTHNQYLGVYYSMGILGLLSLLGFLFFSFTESKKNYYSTALLLLITLFLVTENLFYRQIGIMYIGLLLGFVLKLNTDKRS